MYLDPLYMMILVVTIALSGGVSLLVKTRFNAGQKVNISSGLTGADVAKAILMDAGITDVKVLMHQGFLSDHYNPLNKTLNLSKEVYYGRNASAAGVAAHEVGLPSSMRRDISRCGCVRRLSRSQTSEAVSGLGS